MIEHDISIPALMAFLSPTGRRVGETWEIPDTAVQAVSGNPPDENGYEMTGTLNKVSRSADGNSLVAEIGVAGHFEVEGDPCAFNARIDFTFVPQGVSIPKAVAKTEAASKTLEATGSIKLALLSFVRVMDVPGTDGRLKDRITFELIMELHGRFRFSPESAVSPPLRWHSGPSRPRPRKTPGSRTTTPWDVFISGIPRNFGRSRRRSPIYTRSS